MEERTLLEQFLGNSFTVKELSINCSTNVASKHVLALTNARYKYACTEPVCRLTLLYQF
jgi:hypothetical protein